MFRLIKLAIYGIAGYALYQFVRGLLETERSGGQAGGGNRPLERALNQGSSRQNLTGGGEGQRVVTAESSGESAPHTVGRGVVSR